jgi:hypothetical protein
MTISRSWRSFCDFPTWIGQLPLSASATLNQSQTIWASAHLLRILKVQSLTLQVSIPGSYFPMLFSRAFQPICRTPLADSQQPITLASRVLKSLLNNR